MYKNVITTKRDFFKTNKTRDLDFRIQMLKNLKASILKHQDEIILGIQKDLKRPRFTAYLSEVFPVIEEINYFIKNIKKLAKPQKVKTPTIYFDYKSYEIKEPFGVCLVISPWNYPFLLAVSPLVGAIAAGNCVIIKPSEYSSHSSDVLKKVIEDAFDKNYCEVVLGEADVVENIIDNNVDYIFFTGSTNVGKLIMERASKTLTPVGLELGGKSPCIVDKNINLEKTAKRIAWGKTLNVGQTCIAPDYLVVDKQIKDALIEKIIFYTKELYGDDPLTSQYYGKIINKRNFDRILSLIKDKKVIYGGKYDENTLKIEPTYLDDVSFDDEIMKQEIFGPLLPIVTYENIDDVYKIIERNKNPLAMYIFSKDDEFSNKIINNITCGNVCVNDTIMQVSNHNIPFGGRGNSGIGVYHGKYSFDLFSHKKGVLKGSFKSNINIRFKHDFNFEAFTKFIK